MDVEASGKKVANATYIGRRRAKIKGIHIIQYLKTKFCSYKSFIYMV